MTEAKRLEMNLLVDGWKVDAIWTPARLHMIWRHKIKVAEPRLSLDLLTIRQARYSLLHTSQTKQDPPERQAPAAMTFRGDTQRCQASILKKRQIHAYILYAALVSCHASHKPSSSHRGARFFPYTV